MEEKLDDLCALAGELALLGVKAFMFQEGEDPVAERAFREIARLTGGAYAPSTPAPGAARGAAARGRGLCGRRPCARSRRSRDRRRRGAQRLLGQMR